MSVDQLAQEALTFLHTNAYAQEVLAFVRQHQAWAPVVVFLLAFAESLAVVGFFVPASLALIGIGALAGTTSIEFWVIWLASTAGAFLGDWVSYWIGLKLETPAKRTWPLSYYPDLYERGERFFRRWGVWSIFIGRFFGPARSIIPLIAGVFEMPIVLFQMANLSSAMVWSFVLLSPGFAALQGVQL